MPKMQLPSTDAQASDDRRGAHRYPSMTRARILVEEASVDVECVIRNISVTGALLVLRDTAGVPDTFNLASIYHPALPCHVAWRTHRRLGVQFGDTPIRLIGG